MRDPVSTSPRRRRCRLAGWGAVTAAVVVAVPLSQTAHAEGGRAQAMAASVNINSNVEPIDLNLQGTTEAVEAPLEIGVASSEEGLAVDYVDSAFIADVDAVVAERADFGINLGADISGATLTLLGNQVMTVGEVSSSAICPTGDEPAGGATANAQDVDLGDGPVDLLAGETAALTAPFDSDIFEPGTGSVSLYATPSITQGDTGANAAIGLQVEVSLNGEVLGTGSGILEGLVTGTVDLGVVSCVPEGLADTGTESTIIVLLAAVMFLAAGSSAVLWVRRPAH